MEENNQVIKDFKKEVDKERRNSRIIAGLIIIFIILLILLFLLYLIRNRTSLTGKAFGNSYSTKVELANSYIFASPLRGKANGIEKVRITAFVLDSQGKGVLGKKVTIGEVDGLRVSSVQSITDDLGKAIYDISSSRTGLFIIEAAVEGAPIPQKVNVTFD